MTKTAGTILIEARNLAFSFPGDREVFSNTSFVVCAGDVVGVIGRSGSGKSTLLRVIAGQYVPTSGVIVRAQSVDLSRRGRLGWVGQTDSLYPWLTIEENLLIARPRRAQLALLDDMVALGLEADVLKRRPADLSVGMRKRVEIARASLTDAPLLLLDEPFAPLDQRSEGLAISWLLKTRDAAALMIVSHDISRICEFCTHILVFTPDRAVQARPNEAVGQEAGGAAAVAFRRKLAEECGLF